MKLITEEAEEVQILTESVNGTKKLFIEGIFLQGDCINRNKRLYEMKTLRNAVKVYTENFVNKNRAVGELNHPCLSGDAKLLSVKEGWKHIQDCSENELVYTLNPETKNIEIQPIKKVVINDHSGIMYTLKNRGINTKITPDHRFLIINSRNHNQYQYVTAQEIYEDLNGENKFAKWYIPKYSLGIEKETPENFIISKSDTLKRIDEKTEKYLKDLEIEYNTFAAFLGIYLSEGCCTKSPKGCYNIGITQKIGYKSERMGEILHSMTGLTWNESFCDNEIIWTCYDRRLGEYLYQFGNCYNKYIPRDFIESLNADSARTFLEYFIMGDGRGKLYETYSACDAFSTSKQLIDDIAHVAIIAGFGVALYTEITKEDYVFAGRIIKAENKSPLYFCRFLSTKGVYLDNRFMSMEIEEWNDKVYCVQVENTNFMVEQNGYTYWTGNCNPGINLDRVSHKILWLNEKGPNFYGRAEILETPMGKIAQSLYEAGVQMGVSSRALGSLRQTNEGYSIVGNDLFLSTAADIVHDPSAPDAFVNGIMEGKEWVWSNGILEEKVTSIQKKVESYVVSKELQEKKLELFNEFLHSL